MIYLIVGTREQQQAQLKETLQKTHHKYDVLEHWNVDDYQGENFWEQVPLETGMFGEKKFYTFRGFIYVIKKDFLEKLESSEHDFFFLEEKITAKERQLFSRVDVQLIECVPEKIIEAKKFNVFQLADALGNRDKKELWLLYQRALQASISAEEIIGTLVWQLKNLTLVQDSLGLPQAMNSYVYSKNQNYSKKYTKEEVLVLMDRMVSAFHNRDRHDTLEIQLERIILTL